MDINYMKTVLDEIIKIVNDQIEDAGMHGNFEEVVLLESELLALKKMRNDLNTLENACMLPPFLLRGIKDAVPDFNVELLKYHMRALLVRKRLKLRKLTKEIAMLESFQ